MFIRIDDRLIHGQVVTTWISKLKAKRIVVVDDKVAANAMLQKVLLLATPQQVKLKITNLENAEETFKYRDETLYLVKFPTVAEKLINLCDEDVSIQLCVGNVGKAEGRDRYANSVYLDKENHDALKRVNTRAEVFFQMVPSETACAFSV